MVGIFRVEHPALQTRHCLRQLMAGKASLSGQGKQRGSGGVEVGNPVQIIHRDQRLGDGLHRAGKPLNCQAILTALRPIRRQQRQIAPQSFVKNVRQRVRWHLLRPDQQQRQPIGQFRPQRRPHHIRHLHPHFRRHKIGDLARVTHQRQRGGHVAWQQPRQFRLQPHFRQGEGSISLVHADGTIQNHHQIRKHFVFE